MVASRGGWLAGLVRRVHEVVDIAMQSRWMLV